MANRRNYLFTSESVSEGHPDKVCDRISDAVVDLYMAADPHSRVAIETLVTTNRIGASRLFQISKILDVPVQFFFEEAPHIGGDGTAVRGMAEADSEAFILEFLNSREGLELNRAFVKIGDPKVRKSVVDLVRALSASTGAP